MAERPMEHFTVDGVNIFEVTDAKARQDVSNLKEDLSSKANIDGYYEDMTVGDAKQLVASQYVENKVPYNFRTTGGSADVGNREYVDAVVGGTVAWNQLVEVKDNSFIPSGVTIATNEENGTITISGTATESRYVSMPVASILADATPNHVVMFSASLVSGAYSDNMFWFGNSNNMFSVASPTIKKPSTIGNKQLYLQIVSGTTYNAVIKLMVQDLTTLFGSTIADYVYSLEQATAGLGVSWFRKLFPKDFYEHNAGELLSVSGLQSHDMVGFNAYNPTTGTAEVIGGMQYQITGAYTSISLDGETITPDSNGLFTPTKKGTITVTGGNDSSTCVHLTWSGGRNGEYEPYVKHSYPLDDSLTLRGIPKLDAQNNLYYDGDEYLPDGTVNRRYGVVDLGTLTWTYSNLGSTNVFSAPFSLINKTGYTNADAFPILCSRYTSVAFYSAGKYMGGIDNGVAYAPSGGSRFYITDSAYTDAATFKTAMSGVLLVYELATPATETAEPYQHVQICDDFGTEEYVTDSIVPVGHNTRYPANLRDKLQHLPDLADDDGYYMIGQSNKQMHLELFRIPKAPTSPDGTYTLKATVSGGTPTYTWEAQT